jgi:hypothetical protein
MPRRYCPYPVFRIGCANSSSCVVSIHWFL